MPRLLWFASCKCACLFVVVQLRTVSEARGMRPFLPAVLESRCIRSYSLDTANELIGVSDRCAPASLGLARVWWRAGGNILGRLPCGVVTGGVARVSAFPAPARPSLWPRRNRPARTRRQC